MKALAVLTEVLNNSQQLQGGWQPSLVGSDAFFLGLHGDRALIYYKINLKKNKITDSISTIFRFYLSDFINPNTHQHQKPALWTLDTNLLTKHRTSGGQGPLVFKKEAREQLPDSLGSVDDLFDPRHTQCDVHGGYPSKVEGLQGHLGAWLTNALGTECTHCRAWLHLCPRRKRHRRG